ncbi:uncharacterized protein [Apostichopus japonicus]|uniref:uncharacterized protein isoform X3 n=1 Tax=Stichopus japonicus TaxID=307972 RepID=UPI003AB7A668
MAERLRQDPLPPPWSYGVMRDGRIFFINEENSDTTWLHPVTGKAIATGFSDRNDLPQGWQEGVTASGRTYYIDHLNETTTFYHPLTGKSDMDEEYPEQENANQPAPGSTAGNEKSARSHSFIKKKVPKTVMPLVKRNPNSTVVKEGWLQKRDSGPLGVWRRRWCLLSDFCLFYYKDSTNNEHVGSIMLPSYHVCPVGPKDKGTKKFVFKCEHDNMRTYYFAGVSQEDMESWMSALHSASKLQTEVNQRKPEKDDDEDWGRRTTLPRSVSQPPNGMHNDNSRPSNRLSDPYARVQPLRENDRPHSWQNGYGENGHPPNREDDGQRAKRDYEEVPRKNHQGSSPLYATPHRDGQPNRPRSVGPGDRPRDDPRQQHPQHQQRVDPREQPISRSKSLPRHMAPQSGLRSPSSDPYSTMPRNQNGRPASSVPPTYVDPREIQMRKRKNKNLEVPQQRDSREPSVQSYPSVFESDPPDRPPYPAGYESTQQDRNANYAKQPNQVFQQRRAPTPEQRSVIQSPMQQSPPSSWEPEQRTDLNSPLSYDRSPPMERRDRETPITRQQSHLDERIPQPQQQAEVQMSRSAVPDLRSSPSQRSQRSVNSYNPSSPQSRNGRDSVDVAPSRQRPPVSRNSTLREERSGDQLAPLAPLQGNRLNNRQQNNPNRMQPGQPTSRFRMWQQKAQPYIMLSTGIRLRLSIAANDLLGKSHEELVLFLIQLRRDKANMEEWMRLIDSELSVVQANPGYANENQPLMRSRRSDSLRRSNPNLNEDDIYEAELRKEHEEVSRELEVSLPLINLVDNLVRMGSLYGGQNELIAQEFYKNQIQKDLPPVTPKMMVEYTRKQEEEKLVNGIEEDYRKLQTAEDRELDEKLRKLRELDQKLQQISSNVYVLKEEKDEIENSMEKVRREYESEWENKEAQMELEEQQIRLDRQLIRVRSHLAQGTKDLEDITTENAKLEHEIALLRMQREKKEPTENGYYPGDRELMEIRDEVSNVQSKMTTLDRKRDELMQQMAGFRKETDNNEFIITDTPAQSLPPVVFDFQSTDLDTDETWDVSRDLSSHNERKNPQSRLDRPQDLPVHQQRYSLPPQMSSESHPQGPYGQGGEPLVDRSQQQDQYAPSRHSLPPAVSTSQYGTPESRPQEFHRGTSTDPRRTPSDPRRTPNDPRRTPNDPRATPDQYGRPASQGHRTPNHYERQHPPGHMVQSPDRYSNSGGEPVIRPVQTQIAYSQPPSHGGGGRPYEDQRQPQSGDWFPQGELRSPQGGRRSSYKVTDLDTRESWDISQVDIRSPVDDRPLLSPGEVLPRRDPSLLYEGGPPSFSETPSDSEVAELTRRSETFPRSGPTQQQPPPPVRGNDSYRRVKHRKPAGIKSAIQQGSVKDDSSQGALPVAPPAPTAVIPSHGVADHSLPLYSHDALQHGFPNPASVFTPIVQLKENTTLPENSAKSSTNSVENAPPLMIVPLPVATQMQEEVATEMTFDDPSASSDEAKPSVVSDKAKPHSEETKKRRKDPPSYNQVAVGFKPKSSQPRSRDSDAESTSSSIKNSTIYGPTPYRRSIEASTRKLSKAQGNNKTKTGKAPPYGQAPPYRPPSSNRNQPTIEREVASDTEAMPPPPPPTQQTRRGLKTQDPVPRAADDLHIGTLERALQAAEVDPGTRNGNVVKSSLKNVEVDESTGGGLPSEANFILYSQDSDLDYGEMRTHSLPLSYLRAKRRVVKFSFFSTVHPYPSSRNKLGVPGKIIIPERYNPAEDDGIQDKTKLTEEERAVRDERAENIAKMLSEHSMQSWHPSEINHNWLREGEQTPDDLHNRVQEEKLMRQSMLAKTRALAEEVKEQSLLRGRVTRT